MEPSTTIVLAEDHALVRDMLRDRLAKEADFLVVASVDNAADAVTAVLTHLPTVAILDISMAGQLCFDAARTIRQQAPETRLIFLSAHYGDRVIGEALQVKANGYVTKDEPPLIVVQAIRTVASHGVYYSSRVLERLVVDADGIRPLPTGQTRLDLLTPRERDVMQYLARGLSKKEIAGVMHLSVKTVDRHTCNLMGKLDIHDRVELARYAIREGLTQV